MTSKISDLKLKEKFEKYFSEETLENEWKQHLANLEKVKQEALPAVTKLLETTTKLLIELATTTETKDQTRIQKRLGAIKRAHLSYLKGLEQSEAWETAESVWRHTGKMKDLVLNLIALIPQAFA